MSKSKDYDHWVKTTAANLDKTEIVDEREAAKATVMVCRLQTEPLYYPDNLVAPCSKCFRMVQFRPHSPKEPKKLCDECAAKDMAGQKDVRFMITPATADDIVLHMIKKKMN